MNTLIRDYGFKDYERFYTEIDDDFEKFASGIEKRYQGEHKEFDFYDSKKLHEYLDNIKETWQKKSNECDSHNISEAFRLMVEETSASKKKEYIRFYQNIIKDTNSKLYIFERKIPLKWKKEYDN